ncbi:MAG: sortase [Candidatus Dormibacteraeota bacterium]|nr:sortase [Candidatus Dormibacteraeota bacterium]
MITESQDEASYLESRFSGSGLQVLAVCLPSFYVTKNDTRLKARALQYMVELRRNGFNARPGRTFIVHFDEETVMTEPHVLVLLDYLSRSPKAITQGPILYPLEWEKTPWICRVIESTRPFGCSECAQVMQNPPPPHLHGSNLVVDQAVEDQVGWDFGRIDGQPFIAEDLLFGIRAYALLGDEAFGWHGATALEQPPLSLYWALQQRVRWVLGALQGLRALSVKAEYRSMGRARKLKLSASVYLRIATYALGFPIGLLGLVFLIHPAGVPEVLTPLFGLRIFLLLSALGWILSYQIGLRRNLREQKLTWWNRVLHHVATLALTPIVGLCETAGPYVALVRWLAGRRQVAWTPTPKLAERPSAATPRVVGPGAPATMPAWLMTTSRLGPTSASRRPRRSPAVAVGLALITAGAAILLFATFEFGMTSVLYQRSQQTLLADFKTRIATPAKGVAAEGSPVALLTIPRLGATQVVVQGTSPRDLDDGPGHVSATPMPGEFGNVVIMGRRTTYGGPFRDLDALRPGDQIRVTTSSGAFAYTVKQIAQTGLGDASVLNGTADSRLTLITSTPAFLPTGRLAVVASLQGAPLDLPQLSATRTPVSRLGLAGDTASISSIIVWGLLLVAGAWAAVAAGRRWPGAVRNLLATPVLLALFLVVCTNLNQLLPGTL